MDSIAPKIQFEIPTTSSGPFTQNWIFANVSAFDVALNSINISLYNSSSLVNWNGTLASPNYSEFNSNFTGLPDGVYSLNATATDSFGHINWINITNIVLDSHSPTYSNPQNQSDNDYAPNKKYQFNITWDDFSGIGNVWINFSGVVKPVAQNSSGVYTFEESDLAAGTYSYFWYASDIAGNLPNYTSVYNYSINPIEPTINLNIFPNNSIELGTTATINFTKTEEGVGGVNYTLYVDGKYNGTNLTWTPSVGNHSIIVNSTTGQNYTSTNVTSWINVTDTTAPTVTLTSPPNNQAFAFDNNNITFNFNSNDASGIADCSIYLNGSFNQNGSNSTFTINNNPTGLNLWYINCSDNNGNANISDTKYFTVLSNFTNTNEYNYTNLTAEPNISSVLPFYVNNSNGIVNWTEAINFSSGFDWSQCINISKESIYINSTCLELNKNATLTFYNINFTQPNVTRDGSEYYSSTGCYDYNKTQGVLSINITGAGEYIVENKSIAIVYTSGSSSGGGGGSSSGGNSNICATNWTCTSWGECADDYTQIRTCSYPETYCEPETKKPKEIQFCTPSIPGSGDSGNETKEPISQDEGEGFLSLITGNVIGTLKSGTGMISLIFIALLISVGIGVTVFRRSR